MRTVQTTLPLFEAAFHLTRKILPGLVAFPSPFSALFPTTRLFFRPEGAFGKDAERQTSLLQEEKKPELLLCSGCHNYISEVKFKTERSGQHSWHFFNPAGLGFSINCYLRAPGCRMISRPISKFSWFRGYSWQICICENCLQHIGWLFCSSEDTFYGLIPEKLRSDSEL